MTAIAGQNTERSQRCPYCAAGKDNDAQYGVARPRACGARVVTPLRRFFRWCWIETPHLHEHCTYCHGRWITPFTIETNKLYAAGFDDGVKHARQEMRP